MAHDSSRQERQLKKFVIEISKVVESKSFQESDPELSPSPIESLAVRSKPSFIIEDFNERPKSSLCNQITKFLNDSNFRQGLNQDMNRNGLATGPSDNKFTEKKEPKEKLAEAKKHICCGKCTIV